MPTNDERRELAARLRELAVRGNPSWPALMEALGCPGRAVAVMCLADLIDGAVITGGTSDGYHTFDELYDHRAKLFSVIVKTFADRAWKSRLHHDGSMYDGMFIVGIDTPDGQATYHYDIDPYWLMFDCRELPRAPKWDGHTPAQAIERIAGLADLIEPEERTCHMRDTSWDDGQCTWGCICSECGAKHEHERSGWMNFCPNCGAKVIQE